MIRISLIPYRKERRQKMAQQVMIYWGIAALFGVLIAFGWDWYMSQLIDDKAAIKHKNEEEIAKLKTALGKLDELEERKKGVQKRLDIIANLRQEKDLSVHVLDELSTRVPNRVWFVSVGTANYRLSLSGMASSNDDVAELMRNLEGSAYFSTVDLTRTSQKEAVGMTLNSFDIGANITHRTDKPARAKGGAK